MKTSIIPKWKVWLTSWFDGSSTILLPFLDKEIFITNDKSKEVLGLEYKHDLKDSLREMGYSIIGHGIVPDKRKK